MNSNDYERAFNQSPAIMVIVSADYTVKAASKGFLKVTLNERENITGRRIFDVFPKIGENIEQVLINTMRDSFNKVLKEKEPDTTPIVRFDIPNNDSGEEGFDIRYWKAINTPIFDDKNNIKFIKQMYVDVTDSRELSAQLELEKENLDEYKTAEEYIRNSFKQAPVPICVLRGPEHLFELVNKEFLRIAGLGDYIGKSVREALPELEGQGFFEILDQVYETEEPYVGSEAPIIFNPDGQKKADLYVDFVYQVLYDAKGNKEGIFVLGVDVTDKVAARRKLEKRENTLNQLLNSVPIKISHTDEEANMVFLNQQWMEETGYTRDELKGDGWLKAIHPDDTEEAKKRWDKAIESGTSAEGEYRLIHRKKGYRWNLNRAVPIKSKDGDITMWVDTKTDIHDQKKQKENLEKAVGERTEELRQANKKLLRQNEEIEKQKKEIEAFAYISSHDLQEPLRKIQIFAGRIREVGQQNLSERMLDYFERMEKEADRMQALIDDLLSFSRVKNEGKIFEKVDLANIVEEVKADLMEVIEEKNATIKVVQNCQAPVIVYQFRQLMKNLLSNALKFSKPDTPPTVVITAEDLPGEEIITEKPDELKGKIKPEKRYCHIRTEDNGIGFDPSYRERIFEAFQRLHSKDEYSGTGIGLAIVKKIVENHDGVIIAESERNKGARFDIYLPVNR